MPIISLLKTIPQRKGRIAICAILACLILVVGAPDAGCALVVDRIVAVVNEEIISLYELNRAAEPFMEQIKNLGHPPQRELEIMHKVRQDILDRLIDNKLKDQKIKMLGITVSEREIDAAIERIKETRGLTDEDLRQGLERQGETYEGYRTHVKEQILRSRLVNLEVESKIIITKEDVLSYYEQHRDNYSGENKYRLQHVFVRVTPFVAEPERNRILKTMKEIREKLAAGGAVENIRDEFVASLQTLGGGDLGLFGLEELSPQIKAAISELKPGECTPVLETDFGYQIVVVQDIVESEVITLEKASPEIEQILYREIVDQKFASWLESLRKVSHIRVIQ